MINNLFMDESEYIQEYWVDGKKWFDGYFLKNDKNIRHGYWIEWDQNGHKMWEGNYIHGKRDGEWVSYSGDDRNNKTERRFYAQGKRIGMFTKYYCDTGNKLCEGYVNSLGRHGLWNFWDKNGNMQTHEYENGMKIADSPFDLYASDRAISMKWENNCCNDEATHYILS